MTHSVNATADASITDDKKSHMILPKDTTLGYKVLELQIGRKTAKIVPCLTHDVSGGFMSDKDIVGHKPQPYTARGGGTSYTDGTCYYDY